MSLISNTFEGVTATPVADMEERHGETPASN